MTEIRSQGDPIWVPEVCTLPTADQPLRVAEFDTLYRYVIDAERVGPTRLLLTLPAEPGLAGRAADLTARETACCDFFTFTLIIRSRELQLAIETPSDQVDVLDAVARRVEAGRRT